MIEALTYIIVDQNPEINDNSSNCLEEIQEELNKNLQKILGYLEQNRKDIEISIDKRDKNTKEKYETLYKHQEGIRNLLIETKEIVSKQNKVEEKLLEIERIIKEHDYREKIDQIDNNIEQINTKLKRL